MEGVSRPFRVRRPPAEQAVTQPPSMIANGGSYSNSYPPKLFDELGTMRNGGTNSTKRRSDGGL